MKPPVDESLKYLAARSVRRQVRQLTEQIEGIRNAEDIEFVHRARVASRRLRTALAVFADPLGPQRVKDWRRALSKTGRRLGDARDKDVQIQFLAETLAATTDPALIPGLARILARCEKRRAAVQPRVIASLKQLLSGRVLHEVLAACKEISPKGLKAAPASPAVFAHAEEHILARFEELWAFRSCLAAPSAWQQHHAMRIAAKRLRYTLEIYRPAYGRLLEAPLDVMKQIQTFLGDIHDCDVWVGQLGKAAQKETQRTQKWYGHAGPLTRFQPGFDFLLQERSRRRRELFELLVRYWSGLTEEGFWDDLTNLVRGSFRAPDRQCGESTAEEPMREGDSTTRLLRWRSSAAAGNGPQSNGDGKAAFEFAGLPRIAGP